MSAKPTKRSWNDVQTAIATAAIVTTLGMWNLFAAPAKTVTAQAQEPTLPPTEPPTEPPAAEPTSLPYVKIIFTQAPQAQNAAVVQQPQQQQPTKKKRKNNGGGGGGGAAAAAAAPVTQTKSS
jgi:hypothetical protein